MKLFGRILGSVGLLALLVGGIVWIFSVRLVSDSTPVYSSLRADPQGVRGIYDALDRLPGIQVERWIKPLEKLPVAPVRTLILAGLVREDVEKRHLPANENRSTWDSIPTAVSNRWDEFVRSGGRVVIAFAAETGKPLPPKGKDQPKKTSPSPPALSSTRPDKSSPERTELDPETGKEIEAKSAPVTDWEKLWGVRVENKPLSGPHSEDKVSRAATAPANLPDTLAWNGDLHFTISEGTPWRVLYTLHRAPVAMEMSLGRGSIVLLADSYYLTNAALQKDRSPELLSWLFGSNSRVTFDENHLGVQEAPGIASLARRYGLGGAALTLLLLAALFLWRRLAWFVPPAPELVGLELAYQPTAGLEALLRRSVPPAQLLPTCVAEWRRTARRADATRVDEAVTGTASPLAAHNAAVRALRRR